MGNWTQILNEIKQNNDADGVRRAYIKKLADLRERNVIAYYSGWLSAKTNNVNKYSIDDSDKNGFMSAIHQLDRTKGLDLILHTPGGGVAAAESLIHYLRQMFDSDIEAFVPQLSMSAGTMIALACQSVTMGLHSNLGPYDPQIGGTPAHAIRDDFNRAGREMKDDPSKSYQWQPIIGNYSPGLITRAEKSIELADEIVEKNLREGMLKGDPEADAKVEQIKAALGDHNETKLHERHITPAKLKELGVNVISLETDNELQDALLSVHHAMMITFDNTDAAKIIENHLGTAYVRKV